MDNRLIVVSVINSHNVCQLTSPSGASKKFYIENINEDNKDFINFFRSKYGSVTISVETLKLFSQLCDEQDKI